METLPQFWPLSSHGKLGAVFLSSLTICYFGLILYRLRFSSLAGFPGPKFAAATGCYEFYYDFFRNGTYIFEIEKMHQRYGLWLKKLGAGTQGILSEHATGSIIRVNPYELSIHDADFYNEVYFAESKRRTDSYDHFLSGIGVDGKYYTTCFGPGWG